VKYLPRYKSNSSQHLDSAFFVMTTSVCLLSIVSYRH